MLIVTIATTMTKLATSPVAADNPLATTRMITSGLRKRERNCSQSGDRLTTAASLGPKVFNRDRASLTSRPAAVVTSRARSRSTGCFQISSAPISSIAGFIAPLLKSSAHRCASQRRDRSLRCDPSGDLRPMISQRIRPHEQPDMAARHDLLNDTVLRRADKFGGIEDLLRRRNVVVRASEQISGAGDVVEIELAAEADEFAPGKAILLENLVDHLKIPASRQVDRIFIPALERLLLCEVCRVVDMLIEVDM